MQNAINMIPNPALALQLAKKQKPELIYDAVNLEGINFTLPEIMTLLDGVTVGGHKISDQQIALNQAAAWNFLFSALEKKQFELSEKFTLDLHAIAAREEALSWGKFRDQQVTIAGTTYLPPDANSPKMLPHLFETMIRNAERIPDIYDRAIFVFLEMARTQFFYDVNKRMGRFLMNGILLKVGYPVINVPAKRQLEFNTLMLEFYESNHQAPMNSFLRSCLEPRITQLFK
jgi:Fic family protein